VSIRIPIWPPWHAVRRRALCLKPLRSPRQPAERHCQCLSWGSSTVKALAGGSCRRSSGVSASWASCVFVPRSRRIRHRKILSTDLHVLNSFYKILAVSCSAGPDKAVRYFQAVMPLISTGKRSGSHSLTESPIGSLSDWRQHRTSPFSKAHDPRTLAAVEPR